MVSFCLVFRGSLQSHWHVLNENLPKIEPIHLSGTIVSIIVHPENSSIWHM